MILFIVSCSDHYKPSPDLTKNIVQACNAQIVLHNICNYYTGCIKKRCKQNSEGHLASSPRSHLYQHLDHPVMKLCYQTMLLAKLGPAATSFGYD